VVPTAGLTQPELAQYWSRIATTDFEDRINSQLQSCFPEIQRVSVVPAGAENATIARVRGTPRQVSLKSLGEGACRFFGLALAASSASGGVLLIDEVEIGIHYSVQLELWRFLGHMAREFRVQIFATTHSEDAVRAFGVVAAELPEADGQLIRLQSRSGAIEAVVFDSEDLACARETGHEVR
jgi:predicted ATPase